MYSPEHFRHDDQDDTLRSLIGNAPFATLISAHEGRAVVTAIPCIMDDSGRILGHVARANPHTELLGEGATAQLLIHGPHCYISPSWYAKPSVPTWNYAMVEMAVRVEVLQDDAAQDLLDALTKRFENPDEAGETAHMDRSARARLLPAIHCFALQPLRIDTTLKLSQNKSPADQQQIVSRLAQRDDENSQAIASLMLQQLAKGFAK